MPKYSFQNDYSEGAHPRILEALVSSNLTQEIGYSEDRYCLSATEKIHKALGNPDVDIHFVSGGTQANLLVMSSCMRPFESVIAVESGHICVHETGAVEATGHKVHTVKGKDGKVTTNEIQAVVDEHYFEHMVKPRVVYISQSTEVGTIYSAAELREISALCKKLGLILFMDGARLGAALSSARADLDLKETCSLVDALYIGGTKNGALIGEAIVINNPALKPDFRYCIKQRGALLAKGRLLGIQFDVLFNDNLFYDLARHANLMAERLTRGMFAQGYNFLTDSPTNQIFPILPNDVIAKLREDYLFYDWAKMDTTHTAVRLVTSWATPIETIDEFLKDLKILS
ncbi:MAG: aminotransferase class V-fold PLP-dependent enzyme [Leptolinea sp.]|nr:aminotransferase class V-fold PLP-dependent enzyme [Leptolinea sp.]